ncbi:hypothetical protein F7734_54575 [Scytonema sp. UIC 10036]|uniref:hypothetical protein n=1 Tax=Scytonema sp. UIC 10036 TaxID=2304196 RepID=UPI0012DA0BC4|nr:hypothetical protein [Scytonema sp. UIC 10036]MUH00825.1 hypothetical protein [Scytonema sp. UIC 10036]
MPLRKSKTGTVTGASLEPKNRGRKGGLTGSKRVTGETETETTASEGFPLPDVPSPYGFDSSPEVAEADSNARAKVAEKLKQTGQAVVGAIINTASAAVQATNNGTISANTGVDFAGIVATGSAEVPQYVEGMSNAESTKRRLEIQRQRNTIAVMTDNKRLEQDIVTLGIEHRKLEGKVIDYHTEGVHNQTKTVQFHRAETARDIETSKLVQDKEHLVQQNVATEGTQSLTPGIKKEWEQKLELQSVKSEKLRLEIESAKYDNEYKRQELEVKLLSGF